MRRIGAWLEGAAAVVLTACTPAPERPEPAASAAPAPGLVGTWRLVSVSEGDSASAREPFGASPQGYLVYDTSGHVFAHVRRRLSAPARGAVWTSASREQLLEIVESYAASFGTYQVDSAQRIVTHRIEGESPPARGVLERATPFELRDDTLHIGVGTARRWTLVRVPPRPGAGPGAGR